VTLPDWPARLRHSMVDCTSKQGNSWGMRALIRHPRFTQVFIGPFCDMLVTNRKSESHNHCVTNNKNLFADIGTNIASIYFYIYSDIGPIIYKFKGFIFMK